ncbi:MAG: FG-GAP repeat domain-containing protein [Candidatus Hodarchaeales archaeon]|jgi:hypothetical protein
MRKLFSYKIILFIFFVFLVFLSQTLIGVYSGTNLTFTEHIISTDYQGALDACTVDLDLDGDVDIVTSASQIDTISWWENKNDTFTEHIIDDSFDEVIRIHVVDLDFDGDFDIMGGAQRGDELAWWENDEMAFTKHVVADNIDSANSLFSGDIDNDGDLDLFSSSDDDISWWENDGQQNFVKHRLISAASSSRGFIFSIYALDLDNDTDIDFISGDNVWSPSTTENTIYYWLNDGNQVFTQKTVEGISYSQFHGFDVTDLDKDGDIDLCATSPNNKQIDWFENDGQLNFSQHTVVSTFDGANDVHPGDIDEDGDLDLIAVAYYDDKISWFENDGAQNFKEHVIRENFDGAVSCMFTDINQDGKDDVLGLAWEGGEIIWWEQTKKGSSTASFRFDIVIMVCTITIIIKRIKR